MNWPSIHDWAECLIRTSTFGAVLIVGTWIVLRNRHIAPSYRSWLWRLLQIELLILLWPNVTRIALPGPPIAIEPVAASPASPVHNATLVEPSGEMPVPVPTSGPSPAWPFPSIFVGAWMLGAFVFVGQTIRRQISTRRWLRESQSLADPTLEREFTQLCEHLGIRRLPRLRVHQAAGGPQAVGIRQPAVIFPPGFFRNLNAAQVRLVLAHELAHIRRRDLIWLWPRRLLGNLLFFNPLIWFANRQSALADEMACDAIALKTVNAPAREYAGTLLLVTESLHTMGAAPMFGTGMSESYRGLRRRLIALGTALAPSRSARWKRRVLTGMAMGVVVLFLAIGWFQGWRNSNIVQMDPSCRVLGFNVSRGVNHQIVVERKDFRVAGLNFSRSNAQITHLPPGSGNSYSVTYRLPATRPTENRLLAALRKVGLSPKSNRQSYSYGFSEGQDSYAILVRIAADA